MNYSIRFHPEVEEDLLTIQSWYEKKVIGLGDEFLAKFYFNAAAIVNNPFLYPKVYHEFHRYLLPQFPYILYYIIKIDCVIVLGVFHHARDPNLIRSEL